MCWQLYYSAPLPVHASAPCQCIRREAMVSSRAVVSSVRCTKLITAQLHRHTKHTISKPAGFLRQMQPSDRRTTEYHGVWVILTHREAVEGAMGTFLSTRAASSSHSKRLLPTCVRAPLAKDIRLASHGLTINRSFSSARGPGKSGDEQPLLPGHAVLSVSQGPLCSL
jgi:hypothetical protein